MDVKETATIMEKKQFRSIKSNGLMKLKDKVQKFLIQYFSFLALSIDITIYSLVGRNCFFFFLLWSFRTQRLIYHRILKTDLRIREMGFWVDFQTHVHEWLRLYSFYTFELKYVHVILISRPWTHTVYTKQQRIGCEGY